MKERNLRVVFMGTPEFAVAPLDKIIQAGYEVVAVVTVPDKPAGRGQKISESAVKKYALKNNLNLLQPEKLNDDNFIEELTKLKPEVMVVVAFRLLPKEVWSLPSLGTFNLHASLLPQYRGASPINFSIINGDNETGVTTFFIDEKIDTGEILLQERIAINENENAGELHDRLQELGSHLVVKTLQGLEDGTLKSKKQELKKDIEYKYAPRIFKKDCLINWEDSIENIHNLIRGLSPYPVAYTHLVIGNEKLKIFKIFSGYYSRETHNFPIGKIIIEGKDILKIAIKEGYYFPKEIQLEGKKRMNISDFINGLIDKNNIKVQ